jgi:serine/threonine protein kinase
MGSDEKALSRKETARGARVLPESQRTYGRQVHNDSPGSDKKSGEFSLEEKWIIDPTLLFVGPKIGEGAHGKVYEGKYLDHEVAVKILQPPATLEDVPKMESRFAREVDMLSRVQHKNLVEFVGACREPAMVIVTELLGGKSLKKYMASQRPKRLGIRRAVSYALDIAQAMDCLHLNGIIHRDLKPDNLLLTADQKTVKLVDFGLAREETLTEMMTAETGTYRWMAPELYSTVTLRNGEKKHYNHKVDVYSFSIVLWELLVNRMPFEGMSNLQAAYAAAFKKVRPEVGKENFPSELVFILQSCWAEDPDSRPNFTQVVRMLNAFLSTLPPPTPPPCGAPVCKIVPSLSPLQKETNTLKLDANTLKLDQSSNSTGNAGIVTKSRGLFMWFGQCFMAGPEASKSTST